MRPRSFLQANVYRTSLLVVNANCKPIIKEHLNDKPNHVAHKCLSCVKKVIECGFGIIFTADIGQLYGLSIHVANNRSALKTASLSVKELANEQLLFAVVASLLLSHLYCRCRSTNISSAAYHCPGNWLPSPGANLFQLSNNILPANLQWHA